MAATLPATVATRPAIPPIRLIVGMIFLNDNFSHGVAENEMG